jgi:hypothetical protein
MDIAVKREPLLADRMLLLAHERSSSSSAMAKLASDLKGAHRIVFDEAASRTMARVGRDLPDEIAEQMRFAAVPYPVTWIEVDARTHYAAITGLDNDPTADARLGWLIKGNFATSFAQGPDGRTAMLPFSYVLHRPWPDAEQRGFCELVGIDLDTLDTALWGSSTGNPKLRDARSELRPRLRLAHTVRVVPRPGDERLLERGGLRKLLFSGAGELRMILAALLLLNRPAKPARYTAVPPGRGWIGNKHKPYVGYSTVSIDVGDGPPLLPLHRGTGQGSPHRHHEVRPHYAHHWSSTARGCDHEYVRLPGFRQEDESAATRLCRWECSRCSTIRFRRRAHSRGDATLGVSVQAHTVTDSRCMSNGA